MLEIWYETSTIRADLLIPRIAPALFFILTHHGFLFSP